MEKEILEKIKELKWLDKCPVELCFHEPKDLEDLIQHWNEEHSKYFGKFPEDLPTFLALSVAVEYENSRIDEMTLDALKELRKRETETEALSFYDSTFEGKFLTNRIIKEMKDTGEILELAIESLSSKGEDLLEKKQIELWKSSRGLVERKQQSLRSDKPLSQEILQQVEEWDRILEEGRIPDSNYQFSTREEAERNFAIKYPYKYRIYKKLKPYKKGEAKPQIVNPEIRQGVPVCPYGFLYDSAKQICVRIETRYPTLERKSEELSSEKKLSSEEFIQALVESKGRQKERDLVVATSLLPKEEVPTAKKEFDIEDLVTLENLREQRRRRELRKESGE